MASYAIRTRHWTRKEYDRLIELGLLHEDERIELIGGQMIVAEPKGTPHSTSVTLTADALRVAFGDGWLVRQQDPVALDDESEPEPDIVVVTGTPRDYLAEHPSRPALVIEVSESSLRFDRAYKGSVYARAGVADYWIVNLVDRVLEVRRRPVVAPSAKFGWRYADVKIVRENGVAAPLAKPEAAIAVADLLP